ncbi:MAG: thiamine pyrophosphate-dependent dehydrogenase E1 component subunit alpha [Sphingomonadaceae bacterium]|uniref:thiamine pyrophosphate-dependent dehydrogenase E1 component subunit alpha n=1 Tax=Thermaurantiacus sp. TaxID=2820283 RepID=UPI00298F23B5|nr:thiamine pyrophosphate-dependent dehydrogenase E1 component subunit alpha [Thermaurantiacus sp.]MCS6986960.1 thiamine pyrophosphate-dependent dehydrogenase E1 component subunit alpha [Sphingomonadaceae bacterium]MDW8415440.1 thiamine pyrophosphate-dependent dehydrogenase E1 component subunit alpha [Thermaurantiacus sp.]
MPLTPELRRGFWRTMCLSRAFDDAMIALYWEGKLPIFQFGAGPLPGELHCSNGAEPVGAGVCAALGPEDMITADHRPHHVAVARGVDLDRMAAELLGRRTGLSQGKGGHMHIYDPAVNFASSGIIAEGMAVAAGMALARRLQKRPGIAVAFIGEGAANQGAFHEVCNMVGLWKLPVVVVVQDNEWAVSTGKRESTAVERNSDRASAYAMAGEWVGTNDPDDIFLAAERAVARARAGEGGTILELRTARLAGHFMGDQQAYIPAQMKQVDPLPLYREKLIRDGVLSAEEADAIAAEAKARIARAVEFAKASPWPEPAEAMAHVFAGEPA